MGLFFLILTTIFGITACFICCKKARSSNEITQSTRNQNLSMIYSPFILRRSLDDEEDLSFQLSNAPPLPNAELQSGEAPPTYFQSRKYPTISKTPASDKNPEESPPSYAQFISSCSKSGSIEQARGEGGLSSQSSPLPLYRSDRESEHMTGGIDSDGTVV